MPGSDNVIELAIAPPEAMRELFADAPPQALRLCRGRHRPDRRFARGDGDRRANERSASFAEAAGTGAEPIAAGQWSAYRRDEIAADQQIAGPGADPRPVIDDRCRSRLDRRPRRRRHAGPDPHLAAEHGKAIGTDADPVMLEIFGNLFMAIAEEMGVALQSTATSVNIKERLDFSCALFDASGALIANAPHIPVHLGSMGESIRTIIESRGERARRARHPARRRLCPQRPLSRRHASARHHGDRAGVLQ